MRESDRSCRCMHNVSDMAKLINDFVFYGVVLGGVWLNIVTSNATISGFSSEKQISNEKLKLSRGRGETSSKKLGNNLQPCSIGKRAAETPEQHSRHPRDAPKSLPNYRSHETDAKPRKLTRAVYFSEQKQLLALKEASRNKVKKNIPYKAFTVEMWIKAEGGQFASVPIIGLFDVCGSGSESRGWTIGIRTAGPKEEHDARIFFTLQTDRHQTATIVRANRRYEVAHWTHVAALYTGTKMKLFVNGAMVGVGKRQVGDLFDPVMQRCKEIKLGGSPTDHTYFRGYVAKVRLWNISLSHSDIIGHAKGHVVLGGSRQDGLIFADEFDNLSKWIPQVSKKPPPIYPVASDSMHNLRLTAPPCGKTVCDDPDVVLSYVNERNLRTEKTIRYRIINILNDDGMNGTVTEEQIILQHQALIDAFRPYNISWELTIENVTNSFLRQRLILFGCDSAVIGDGTCDEECQTPMTGNDGGDCDEVVMPCSHSSVGNGVCDYECDRAYHGWDGGDCCLPGPMVHRTCFDPANPLRAYLSVEEYRDRLGFSGSQHLNVFFATWTVRELIGLATFPWEKNLYTVQGGTIVQPENFGAPGSTDSLVHEFGHNLGLWHVHHGVSEMDCNDKCLETKASLTLGDLCSDTPPTPHNTQCRDPDASKTKCGVGVFQNTSFRNYMSYADDDCTDHFTPQQVTRMHCYLDLVYQPWRVSKLPPPIPLKPKILSYSGEGLTFGWVPPLGAPMAGNSSICSSCLLDGALSQYANNATSRKPRGDRSPEEAIGPPDADRCKGSTRIWLPDAYHCQHDCYLQITFKEPVVPQRLLIWATWNARDGIEDVVLYLEDRSIVSLGMLPAYCDVPVTQDIFTDQILLKIRIFTSKPSVGIDAVQVISKPGHRTCDQCEATTYRVSRLPLFETTQTVVTTRTQFTDNTVTKGRQYTYWLYSMVDGKESPPSPPLVVKPGESFCGDGKINKERGEDCDDGNASDGDGCDLVCKVEEFFYCKNEPSLCYIHDGDGVCEEFEKLYSVEDCGFYTPKGFIDQWANTAVANSAFQRPSCPESVVTGEPPIGQGCTDTTNPRVAWSPCSHHMTDGDYWIKVGFIRPVVSTEVIVHFTADGKTDVDTEAKSIQVFLISESGDLEEIGGGSLTLNCHTNPLHIPVQHDLSKPFTKTLGALLRFTSYNIAISAVRLRSSKFLDPVELQACSVDEMYDVYRGRCMPRTCSKDSCEPPTLENGKLSCSGNAEGDLCSGVCNSGYWLKATGDVRCTAGQWSELANLKCVPVDCGRPGIPRASVVCPHGTYFSAECFFKCKRPARREGEVTSVVCEADGLWSMPKSQCRIQCRAPVGPVNAILISKSCRKGRHDVGKRCKFRCHKGYHVEGRARKRRVVKLRCEEEGDWEGPGCVANTCPPPDPVYTGLYQCSRQFMTGSHCYLSCPDDRYNQQKITCLENGQWDATFKMCRFSSTAMCPAVTNNSKGLVLKCNGQNPGSTCEARCRYPHQFPISNHKPEDPSPRDRFLVLTCTGTRRWYPDIDEVQCVESCSVAFVGDGWCDANNNRASCLWDGGDCCSSTMEGRPVQPFPETCTTDCSCKDPDAVENYGNSKRNNRSKSTINVQKPRVQKQSTRK